MPQRNQKGLLERLKKGEDIIAAEGYVFEFERRGYLRAGAFVPEVVLEHPKMVKSLYEEFAHAGSDVVLAFTYYAHREKLKTIGREDDIEKMNKTALRLAREVADDTGTLMAGNICNSTIYQSGNPDKIKEAENMFKEQIEWAVEGGADFIVGETFAELGEAMLALKACQTYGNGLPAVICLAPSNGETTYDKVPFGDACRQLEEAGAAAVGLNCHRGPITMLPIMKKIREACKGPIACLPVPYRTDTEHPTFFSLKDSRTGERAFPVDLPAHLSSRNEIEWFGREAKAMGIQYVGLCCGNASHYLRTLAEAYGKTPPASRFSPNMKQHFIFGGNERQTDYYSKTYKSTLSEKDK